MNTILSSTATNDSGRVKLGGSARLPVAKPVATADNGKVVLGGSARLPAIRG